MFITIIIDLEGNLGNAGSAEFCLSCDVRTQGDCMRLSKKPPWGLILCQEIADFYAKEATQSLQRLNY